MSQEKHPEKGILGGLQAAFAFLVAFIVLRYGILISIFLAAIGGVLVGFILNWWEDESPSQRRHYPLPPRSMKWKRKYPNLENLPPRASISSRQQKSPEENPED